MKKTLELKRPIMVNDKEKKELTYDFDEISCDAYTEAFSYASAKALEATQKGHPNATVMEQDGKLHMYLCMEAIIAVNPDIDMTDLERIKGFDLVTITGLGRNFINGISEGTSSQSSSDEESEVTPESSTQASKKSKE